MILKRDRQGCADADLLIKVDTINLFLKMRLLNKCEYQVVHVRGPSRK